MASDTPDSVPRGPSRIGHMVDELGIWAQWDDISDDKILNAVKTVLPLESDKKIGLPVRPEYHLVWLLNTSHPDREVGRTEIIHAWNNYSTAQEKSCPDLMDVPNTHVVDFVTYVRKNKLYIPAQTVNSSILHYSRNASELTNGSHCLNPDQLKFSTFTLVQQAFPKHYLEPTTSLDDFDFSYIDKDILLRRFLPEHRRWVFRVILKCAGISAPRVEGSANDAGVTTGEPSN